MGWWAGGLVGWWALRGSAARPRSSAQRAAWGAHEAHVAARELWRSGEASGGGGGVGGRRGRKEEEA